MAARRHRGFSLLETSVVLVIVGLVVAMGSMGISMIESARRTSTERKLDQIEKSLMAFRVAYNRLPCPADAALLPTDANNKYGVESVNSGACTTGSTYNGSGVRTSPASPGPTANYSDTTNNVVEGAVPFKALGLPESFMYDGWGRKFAYAVNYNVTATNAMRGMWLADQCGITVNDASGASRTTAKDSAGNSFMPDGMYILVSFGPDGHGAYLRNGTRLNSGVTNTDELTNCHCDNTGTATTYSATYVQKDSSIDTAGGDTTHPFNDLVRVKSRWQMVTPDDFYNKGGSVCQWGVRIDGDIVSLRAGFATTVGDLNGDGYPDLIVSDSFYWLGVLKVVVLWGGPSGFANPVSLGSLNAANSTIITIPNSGIDFNYNYVAATRSIFAVGDLNGDGIDDLVISGQSHQNGGHIDIRVVFGHKGSWPPTQTLGSTDDGTHGTRIYSTASLGAGGSVSPTTVATGDLNGDGIDDLAFYTNYDSETTVYVVFGRHTWPVTLDPLTAPDGTSLFTFTGFPCASGAWSHLAIGDVNGDGVNDLVDACGLNVSAPGHADNKGALVTLFGHTGAWAATTDASALNGANGFSVYGTATNNVQSFGATLALGDVNGDGIQDILTNDYASVYAGPGTIKPGGAVYVIFGHKNPWDTSDDIQTLLANAALAVRINPAEGGVTCGGWFFPNALAAPDFNGDGIADIVMNTPACSSLSPYGNLYVLFGHTGPWSIRNLFTTPLTGTDGVRFDFSYPDQSPGDSQGSYLWNSKPGQSTDINADGTNDIFVGSMAGKNTAGVSTGYLYAIYGRRISWPRVVKLNSIK